jgi:AraC-like DNA-binding protein
MFIYSMKNSKILIFLFLFFINWAGLSFAAPTLNLKDTPDPQYFDNQKIVLIMKGDDQAWKDPAFDDSSWKVLSLPSYWGVVYPGWQGVCWYRLHVNFPDKLSGPVMGINLGVIVDVDEVYFNGEKIGSTGSFGPPRVSAYDINRVYEIPTRLIRPGKDNVFSIRVGGLFTGSSGPYKGSFYIAPLVNIIADNFIFDFRNLVFSILYICAALYFGAFFIRLPFFRENLYFSVFSVITAVYMFFNTQFKYYLSSDFRFLKRIEYFILVLLFVVFLEYLLEIFRKKRNIFHYGYYIVSASCLIAISLIKDYVIWENILFYIIIPSWLVPVISMLLLSFKNFNTSKENRFFFSSMYLLLATLINDVLSIMFFHTIPILSRYSFMILMLCIAYILHRRIIELYRKLGDLEAGEEKSPSMSLKIINKMERAREILKNSYKLNVTREEIAGEININPDTLGKMFKKYTGSSINDYRNDLRINEAVKLLKTTDSSIINIAYAVGFDSLSSFYRVFQKNIGQPPTIYRDSGKSESGDEQLTGHEK